MSVSGNVLPGGLFILCMHVQALEEFGMDVQASLACNKHHLRSCNLQHIPATDNRVVATAKIVVVDSKAVAPLDLDMPTRIVGDIANFGMRSRNCFTRAKVNVNAVGVTMRNGSRT